jgi:tetratricopeptide (TPR) repeat protein
VQLTLKTASVIGPRFEIEVLVLAHPRYAGRETLESQLAELERRNLVRSVGQNAQLTYEFEHNLIQESIYSSLPAEQQVKLHTTVGQALEEVRPEAVDQLAYHYGHTQLREKALRYLGLAADKARHSYANETALKYYEQALALEPRWEWRKAQAEVLGVLGQRDEQKTVLAILEATPGAPAFDVAYLWGQYYEAISDYGHAEDRLAQARNIARERFHRAHEAESLTLLGYISYRRGRYPGAQAWFEQAQALFPPRAGYPAEDARLLAKAANGLGLVQFQQGEADHAKPFFRRALELYHQAGDQRGEAEALSNLGSAAYQQRHFDEALSFHQAALALRRTIGDRVRQGSSLVNLAQAARDSGDYTQAEAWMQSALRIQRDTGNRWDEVNTCIDLGILYQELGMFPEARDYLQRGLRLSHEIGDEAGEAYVLLNSGLVALDQAAGQEARAHLQTGLALARSQQDRPLEAMFASYQGALALALDDWAEAERWSELALSIRREIGQKLRSVDDQANLALTAAARHDLPAAKAYAGQVWAALQTCQGEGPEFPQRAYWACYLVLEACGETAEAAAALQAAFDWVMARAARITTPRWQRSFLEDAPRNRQVLEAARRVLGLSPEQAGLPGGAAP